MVLTRDKILARIWGYDFDGETRTWTCMCAPCARSWESAAPLIETVRGVWAIRSTGGSEARAARKELTTCEKKNI